MGLDAQAFAACLDSRRHEGTVLADKRQGQEAGVRYTPTLFVNGRHMGAPRDYDELRGIIEAELAGQ